MIEGFSFKYRDHAVIADTHFGIEYALAAQGLQIPPLQFREIVERVRGIKSKKLVVAGDLKHEFSKENPLERKHVTMFIDEMTAIFNEILVVRGNHDNFVYYTLKDWGIELIEYLEIGDSVVIHGHKIPQDIGLRDYDLVIMGHEHPSVTLRDSIGVSHKVPTHLEIMHPQGFLVHVLPAISPFALGTSVNSLIGPEEFLSPLLKSINDINKIRVYAVIENSAEYLGPLSKIRR